MLEYLNVVILETVHYQKVSSKQSFRNIKIRFTKHAREKFEFVKHYGFEIDEKKVIEAIQNPTRTDQKNAQYFTIKAINAKYALRVVYEKRKTI